MLFHLRLREYCGRKCWKTLGRKAMKCYLLVKTGPLQPWTHQMYGACWVCSRISIPTVRLKLRKNFEGTYRTLVNNWILIDSGRGEALPSVASFLWLQTNAYTDGSQNKTNSHEYWKGNSNNEGDWKLAVMEGCKWGYRERIIRTYYM